MSGATTVASDGGDEEIAVDVVRDRRWVEREYGREKWPAVAERIRERDDALPQALRRAITPADHVRPALFGGQVVDVPASLTSAAYRGWVAATVARYAQDADAVVELGAGWGANLFGCYLAGGPRAALYVAAEYTEAGRQAAGLLAERDGDLAFEAAAFDLHQPSLELPELRRAVVFTAHAVEQVPHLPTSFVPFVASLADEVTVVHFEPIGWQLERGPSDYAEHHDYNRNLWSLLEDAEVDVVDVQVDVIGVNPTNPTTLVVWRP